MIVMSVREKDLLDFGRIKVQGAQIAPQNATSRPGIE
jgi:hypothetical protein